LILHNRHKNILQIVIIHFLQQISSNLMDNNKEQIRNVSLAQSCLMELILNSKSTKTHNLIQMIFWGNVNSMRVITCADFQPNRISSMGGIDIFVFS